MRKIAVVTGARADYGILYWPIKAIMEHPGLQLQLIVTGSHLSASQGQTINLIKKDRIPISARVEMLMDGDADADTGLSIGIGVMGMTRELRRLKPDFLLVLGDRFEIFAAATAAMALRIPIAHIGGGETDWANCLDGNIRNALTKMAVLHFASHDMYAKRIKAMAEESWRVKVVGMPSLDHIHEGLLSRKALETALKMKLPPPVALVTYHPIVLRPDETMRELESILAALGELKKTTIIFTQANADAGGRAINKRIAQWCRTRPGSAIFASLGRQRYLSMLSIAEVVVGNSSSGIIEAPSFGMPVVNIGIRQAGRIHPENVLDVQGREDAILEAVKRSLDDVKFKRRCRSMNNPFGDGHASERICETLVSTPIDANLIEKRMQSCASDHPARRRSVVMKPKRLKR